MSASREQTASPGNESGADDSPHGHIPGEWYDDDDDDEDEEESQDPDYVDDDDEEEEGVSCPDSSNLSSRADSPSQTSMVPKLSWSFSSRPRMLRKAPTTMRMETQ
jgi:hypothetical protein